MLNQELLHENSKSSGALWSTLWYSPYSGSLGSAYMVLGELREHPMVLPIFGELGECIYGAWGAQGALCAPVLTWTRGLRWVALVAIQILTNPILRLVRVLMTKLVS
jgi:hypothetical protein